MASGLNIALLTGTVETDAELRQKNGQAISVFRLNTVDRADNGKEYPTQFVVILNGDLATQKYELAKAGARLMVIGTHEVGRIYTAADGQPARTNDFSAIRLLNTQTDDLNMAFLFGNLGKDAQLKNAETDKPFSTASLCTNLYAGKGSDGKSQQRSLWNRLNLNGKQATGLNDSLKQGVYIGVLGSYRYSKPYASQSGEQHTEIQFSVSQVVFGGSSYKGGASSAPVMSNTDDLFSGIGDAPMAAPQTAGVGEPAGAGSNLFDNF